MLADTTVLCYIMQCCLNLDAMCCAMLQPDHTFFFQELFLAAHHLEMSARAQPCHWNETCNSQLQISQSSQMGSSCGIALPVFARDLLISLQYCRQER